ncbi:MAG: D-isomer specific 2-hydroxyacid dehydrogenase NAD-binding subunit [Deltaproteobacteria bacterium]|jgi:phosphoglycerate dehydrogenase-like enzyme|nr:D-isomer specific 2-hydroxyacid dehydrogenase NAD-binding subunit [Deltaproteobacteria bacterium]
MAHRLGEHEPTCLLILDDSADDYKTALEKEFPEVVIHACTIETSVGSLIERTDILFTGKISDELISRASRLKWIQAKTTGLDALVNLPSLPKEVLLTSARGIHGPQMSEMVILLMLSLNRSFQRVIRNQDQKLWHRWPQRLLRGKKVGILGVGVVGEAIAAKCKVFGMTVYGIDRVKRDVEAVDVFLGPEEMAGILGDLDFLIIAVPSTPQTQRMIDAAVLSAMKPAAFLLNLGRGEVIDEEALIEGLKNKTIAGAALDTFQKEPLPPDHPFWEMHNVIITPHIGGFSDIYVEQVLPIFRENLRRFLLGERRNLINFIER